MDKRTAKILTKANFAYLISLSAPLADEEAFRMGVDWCIWVRDKSPEVAGSAEEEQKLIRA